MKQFRYYEVAAVIVPGAVLLLAANLLWPGYMDGIPKLDISIGGLGIFVIIAYVAGQLLHSLGNILESGWWCLRGGWPQDRISKGSKYLLSDRQIETLKSRISSDFGYGDITFDKKLVAKDWRPVFRQIYAAVQAAARDERAYIFNSEYGMFRGVAAACLVVVLTTFYVRGWNDGKAIIGAFAGVLFLAGYRMNRFSELYATETLVQFLALPMPGKPEKKLEE